MSKTGQLYFDTQQTEEYDEGYRARPEAPNPYPVASKEAQRWALGHADARDDYFRRNEP